MSSSTRGPDHDEAEKVLELADVLTMSATPATMPDSDGRTLALLVLVPSVAAHIGIAGAGPGDAIASTLLGAGFERLARIEAPEIDSLPILTDWRADLNRRGGRLQVVEPGGLFYDGDLGPRIPRRWHAAALDRRRVVVLVVNVLSVLSAIDAAVLVQACRDDHVIAAHVPLQVIDQLSR